MSLGIKSLWRARSRCCDITGLSLISRDLLPSRVLRPSCSCLGRRFESTMTSKYSVIPEVKPRSLGDSVIPTRKQLSALQEYDKDNQTQRVAPQESKNKLYKDAFRVEARKMEEKVSRKLHKPFISAARDYPSETATRASYREHLLDLRRQVGHSIIWDHFHTNIQEWKDSFHLIKEMTPKWSDRTSMSAVRIVLPKSWDIDVKNQNLEYVDSATGVVRKLRSSVDQNPSAIVLRGKSSVLTAAADEIVRVCKEAKVYELGEVGSSDYKTKQLWPTIEGALNEGASLPEDKTDNIWVHKEYQPYELTTRYEDIPVPFTWTMESFEGYIVALVYGQIPAHRVITLYGNHDQYGRFIDTEGIRTNLILQAFEDPASRPFITVSTLKMALSLMTFKGGHRAKASSLIKRGEEWGVPMDTDIFNIMLEGYVQKQDVGFFCKVLRRMQERYYRPNLRTWLLFLQLVKGEDERRQVIVAMYELGMFNHNATRKGIAEVMASHDAYTAFKSGRTLDAFLQDQKERYGPDWSSVEAVNKIITELLRFHRKESPRLQDCKEFIETQSLNSQICDLSTVNTILPAAVIQKDWTIALWALSLLKQLKCEPNKKTYQALMALCIHTNSPHALGTLYFYGVLDRKLAKASRVMLRNVLLRSHRHSFWKKYQPGIFPKDVVRDLYKNQIPHPKSVMSRIESIILEKWDGYIPTKSLAHTLTLAYQSKDLPLRSQISSGVKNASVQPLVLKLKRTDGGEGKLNVRLVGTFRPSRMMENWTGKRDSAEGGFVSQAWWSNKEHLRREEAWEEGLLQEGLSEDDLLEDIEESAPLKEAFPEHDSGLSEAIMAMPQETYAEFVDLGTIQAIQAKLGVTETPTAEPSFMDGIPNDNSRRKAKTAVPEQRQKPRDDSTIDPFEAKFAIRRIESSRNVEND